MTQEEAEAPHARWPPSGTTRQGRERGSSGFTVCSVSPLSAEATLSTRIFSQLHLGSEYSPTVGSVSAFAVSTLEGTSLYPVINSANL